MKVPPPLCPPPYLCNDEAGIEVFGLTKTARGLLIHIRDDALNSN